MTDTYLNDFHRRRSEELKEYPARQPEAPLEDAMEQYDRIKRGSSRRSLPAHEQNEDQRTERNAEEA